MSKTTSQRSSQKMCPSVNSIIQDSESVSFPPAGINGMLFPSPVSSANV